MHVLQFSGGVDSLACLLLLQRVPGLHVITILTDGAYPSTEAYLRDLHEVFPQVRFIARRTDRELPKYGQPVDIVPLRWTALGQHVRGANDVRYQDTFSCCRRGIWEPMNALSRELGATVVYRGQRDDDRLRDPMADGTVIDGITYRFPIADWTRARVWQYVRDHASSLIPPGYADGEKTSRDCWDCTAYLEDNRARIDNLPAVQRHRVNALVSRWRDDVLTELGA